MRFVTIMVGAFLGALMAILFTAALVLVVLVEMTNAPELTIVPHMQPFKKTT